LILVFLTESLDKHQMFTISSTKRKNKQQN
jgi:hypothetical protein